MPNLRYYVRGGIFILLLSFMLWGPFCRQVLHGDNHLFRPWIMFKGIAVGVVDARFYRLQADGQRELLDRYRLLGHANRSAAPKSVHRLKGRGRAAAVGRALCKQLGAGADVRVESRIATRQGWRIEERGDWNVCRGRGVSR